MKKKTEPYDVIVIGGGAAGMMAAAMAGSRGRRVLLLEKNDTLGAKLLISGGGRCNVTNAEPDTRVLLSRYGDNDKFLFTPFAQFGVREALEFFHTRGMETKVENEGRVFPKSNSAQSVWDVLVDELTAHGVVVRSHAVAQKLETAAGMVTGVALQDGTVCTAASYILATGGASRPETGSTGDGFRMLKAIGHTIIPPDPSLVPVAVADAWVKELSGVALDDVRVSVLLDDEKQFSKKGRILFTHVGLSGPTILNMSKRIGELISYGTVTIALDLV